MRKLWAALIATITMLTGGCASAPDQTDTREPAGRTEETRPTRFTIRPDDYHVPYAGKAGDGRLFFLSEELFDYGKDESYVGLFLWNPDGTFDELKVDVVPRPKGLPPGQAAPAGAEELVEKRLEELGSYKLQPITVEPFVRTVGGVEFGWQVTEYDGTYNINIAPGDFIAYYAPWDGFEYDT